MRAVAYGLIVGTALWACSTGAQARGGAIGGFHGGGGRVAVGGFRGGAAGRPLIAARGMPVGGVRVVSPGVLVTHGLPGNFGRVPIHTSRPFNGNHFACFGFNCFNRRFVGDGDFDDFAFRRGHFFRGFGFGGYPFFNTWGWGGWPYYTDYTAWDYDQQQNQYDYQTQQNMQLQAELQDDQRQQFELEQQLADLRAAAAAPRQPQPPPQPAAAPVESEMPPTVLVFRDHHQVDIRNYAIANNTLWEFAPHWTRKVALSDLDIPATIAANEERGIEFSVPDMGKTK
jgi:hypothetical protein